MIIKKIEPIIRICTRIFWAVSLLQITGCFINPAQRKLDNKWPDHKVSGFTPEEIAAVNEGYILKKNGDTLKGYIKMVINYDRGQTMNDVPLLPFNERGENDIIRVALDDIDYVRLKSPRDSTTTDYMPIHGLMWRLEGRKGQVSMCSIILGENYSKSAWSEEWLLVIGNKLVDIPLTAGNSGVWHPNFAYLLQFINKRYGENFDKKHFKGKQDMVNYILDRENGIS